MNIVENANELLRRSIIYYQDEPVGTVAACDDRLAADNYAHCFVRDFFSAALIFLMDGDFTIVRNFLSTLHSLSFQQPTMKGHERAPGLMPASFRVVRENGKQSLRADFGERAIGRVAPVDSAMWWILLLGLYTKVSKDTSLRDDEQVQRTLKDILNLYLKESFETSPAMLVPDGCFMIDRRMGVYGHPLEIQALFYAMLKCVGSLLTQNDDKLLSVVDNRLQALGSYMRIYYWLDLQTLNKIHRFHSEEFGLDAENVLNIFPESIPQWLDGWIKSDCGYFVGNLGAGRMDFRYFALGNLLSVIFGIADSRQSHMLMNLYENNWSDLVGEMPAKIVYPALVDQEWALLTGCDPKNAAWSYHNGGNWPVLLWAFIGACLRTQRQELAQRAMELVQMRLVQDQWPEYYDGRTGSLIGRRANYNQIWSCTGFLVANEWLNNTRSRTILNELKFL